MKHAALIFIILSGCVEEATPKEAEAAAELQASITPQKQLDEQAITIEQAADAAVKLIEEEAKAEADAALADVPEP